MNTATLRADSAQNTPEIPLINFRHRIEAFSESQNPYTLNLAVEAMAFKCVNVLHLIASQFANPDGGYAIADEVIYFSIQSAIHDVHDIAAVVDAFNKSQA